MIVTDGSVVSEQKMLVRYVRKYTTQKAVFDVCNVVVTDSKKSVNIPVIDLCSGHSADFKPSTVEVTVKNSRKVGVLVAVRGIDDVIRIGWSRCHTSDVCNNGLSFIKAGDKFDAKSGKQKAYDRAKLGHSKVMPKSMIETAQAFAERAKRYFKVDSVVIVGYTEGTFKS